MGNNQLHIGFDRKEKNKPVEIPVGALKRHFAALGSSGSGKTVLVKCVMEEAVRAGIPLIMIDLQGDLASLALMGNKKEVENKGTPGKYWDDYKEKAQVAIYTPASSKGIPISMNPLKSPPDNLEFEDYIQAVDSVAETVASIVGYNTDKGKGSEVKDYLYLLLKSMWDQGKEVDTFEKLAQAIFDDTDYMDESSTALIDDKEKEKLSRSIKGLTIGAESLIFNLGMPLDVERMMTWQDDGKVPVNILYLNTLRDQGTKVNFIADTANQVYNWMLRNPSEDVQLIFILDELAGLVPPIRNPPSKKSIQLLLKQARKYGVSLLLATQNISDVDYKSLGQVSTWALGKLIAKQDIAKVKDIISAISPAETEEILSILPKQNVGQFMLLNPDIYNGVQRIKARWLVTDHTTLDDSKVEEILAETGIKEKFPEAKTDSRQRKRSEDEDKDSSPLDQDTATESEILSMEETSPTQKEVAVPSVKKSEDILPHLETNPLALTAEDLAQKTGEKTSEVSKSLDKMVKDDQLEVEEVDGVKIYWSKKHKMDPSNNIVGPLFEFRGMVNEGKVHKIMKNNIPKTLGVKAIEEITGSRMFHLPMWRIGVREIVEKGGILGFGKKEVEINRFYFLNGLNGTVLHVREKEEGILFKEPSEIVEPTEELNSISDEERLDKIILDDLTDNFLKPKISRNKALDLMKRISTGYLNRKVIPSICWLPVWEFDLRDKDTNERRKAWVEGLYGGYIVSDPKSST